MKRLFAVAVVLAGLASAQTNEDIQFFPVGFWPVCNSLPSTQALSLLCLTKFTAGEEPDMLRIRAHSPATVAFIYVIDGVDIATGKPRTWTGVFRRQDDMDGFSSIIVSAGANWTARIHIYELASIAEFIR